MTARFFGQFLLQRGLVTADDLVRALDHQRRSNADIGDLAVRSDLLTREQAEAVRAEERRTGASFSELAKDRGLLSSEQIVELYSRKESERVLLGEALVAVGAIDEETRDRELAAFQDEGERARGKLEEAKRALGWGADPAIARIVDAASGALFRLAGERTKVGTVRRGTELPDGAYRISASFRGSWNGDYVMGIPAGLGRRVAARVVGAAAEDLDEARTWDALRDLARVALSDACRALSSLGHRCDAVHLAPLPEGTTGGLEGRRIWSVSLATPDGAVGIAVIPHGSGGLGSSAR